MLILVVLAPLRHGAIGALDELELCLAPFVVMITIWVLRLLSLRNNPRRDRDPKRDRARPHVKGSTNIGRKDHQTKDTIITIETSLPPAFTATLQRIHPSESPHTQTPPPPPPQPSGKISLASAKRPN